MDFFASLLDRFLQRRTPKQLDRKSASWPSSSENEIFSLIKGLQETTDPLSSHENDQGRRKALGISKQLVAALEKPEEVVFRQAFESHTYSLCLRLGVDLKIFHILQSQNGSPISAAELAERSGAETDFIVRIMRVLTALDYAAEARERSYTATTLTRAVTIPALEACVVHSSEHAAAVSIFMPAYFAMHGYRSPTDRMDGPFQFALSTSLSYFDYLHSDECKMRNFNTFMTGNRGSRKHWTEWFPVEDVILSQDRDSNDGRKVLVDMGGGKGHDLCQFLRKFPKVSGMLVLQDLPSTIANLDTIDAGIEVQPHDLFTPQPVHGAKAYYTHFLMHDFADSQARIILEHIRDAMTPRYSRLLLNETILPEKDCTAFFAAADITMMAVLSALKRSRKQWVALVESVGLEIVNIWESPHDGDYEGVIEALRPAK